MRNPGIALLGCCLVLCILTACQDISVEPDKDPIIGSWMLQEVRLSGRILTPDEWGSNISFIFRQNGTFQKFENGYLAESGSYYVSDRGGEFILHLRPSGDSYSCWLTGETLMMYEDDYLGVPTFVFNRFDY
jgi:hypothetical protein